MKYHGKIISVFSNKGGCSKTTTTLSLAHGLAKSGTKTLLLDIDSQCNATQPLCGDSPSNNLYDVLTDSKKIADCIRPIQFQSNLYCLPNIDEIANIEPNLMEKGGAGFSILKTKIFDYCTENFDAVVIDCPPNHGIFSVNALLCSHFVIVPAKSGSKNSIRGLMSAQKLIMDLQKTLNPDLKLFKVLITQVDGRTKIGKEYLIQTHEVFDDLLFSNYIPACVDFLNAENEDKTIYQKAPKSAGARAYTKIVNETKTL
jgi:chromosome partitioning protein